ncbi:MAG: hypothetical protein ACTSRZ_08860 [Promethearchaeota archaeon]
MASKTAASGTLLQEVPAGFLIIYAILAIINPTEYPLDWPTIAVMVIVAILGLIGGFISALLKKWWARLMSIISSIIGIIYFGFILAEIFMPALVASGAIGGGSVLDLIGQATE